MKNSDRLQQAKPQVSQPKAIPDRVLEVKWSSRWQVFRRLKELDIACQCSTNQPLLVNVRSPITVVSIWSVLKQHNATRQESIDWLDRCWEAE